MKIFKFENKIQILSPYYIDKIYIDMKDEKQKNNMSMEFSVKNKVLCERRKWLVGARR